MKKYLLLLFSCCLLTTSSANKHDIVSDANLSKTERLYLTCKVWGFLKYYHPKVGTGVYDWDEKLIKVLANTKNITTSDQLSNYFDRWIYAFGPRKPCPGCNSGNAASFGKNFDLSWTQSSVFSSALKSTFRDIEKNRFQGSHHYVEVGKSGQFMPKSESSYYDLNIADENYRLLPLFRFWNYVEYFSPYKYQTDQAWDQVLKEMIPLFLAADTRLKFHQAMLALVVKLDDSHAGLVTKTLDAMPYYNYLPARIEMVEDKALVTEIIDAEKALQDDLQVGDVITQVNGETVKSRHAKNSKYIWGSNEAVKARSLYHTLFMGLQGSAKVTINRNGVVRNTSLPLYSYAQISYGKKPHKEKWRIVRDSVGYVNLEKLEKSEVDQMMNELMETKVLIIDLRNGAKGTYQLIANHVLPTENTFARFTKPDFTYPGKFTWEGSATCGKENEDYYAGKLILLVNSTTQGHAEYSCMCFQTAPNVLTLGSQTAGTHGARSQFALIQNLNSQFTGTGVFYPDGSELQRVGVKLSHEVQPTIDGMRTGKDEVLDQAMVHAEEELERLKALARLAELARKAKLDSIRQDSLLRIRLPLDSMEMDSSLLVPLNGDGTEKNDND